MVVLQAVQIDQSGEIPELVGDGPDGGVDRRAVAEGVVVDEAGAKGGDEGEVGPVPGIGEAGRGEEFGEGDGGGECPVDEAGDVAIVVDEDVAGGEVGMTKGESGFEFVFGCYCTWIEGGDHGFEEGAGELILEPVLTAIDFGADGDEIVPSIGGRVIAGVATVFLRERNGGEKGMMSHRQFSNVEAEDREERFLIVSLEGKRSPIDFLKNIRLMEEVPWRKTFFKCIGALLFK